MLRPEPDKVSVDAWLAGELPPDEASRVEESLEIHSAQLLEELPNLAPDVLAQLSASTHDSTLNDVIARIKSGLDCEAYAPGDDSWREILTPTEGSELLGTIGIYEISEVIATGGMAIVFKGYDPELKRHAAIKVLAPEIAVNATARERFLREARAAAQLEHENVLPIYSIHDEAVPYFAMRYVSGGTLADRLDRGDDFTFDELRFVTLGIARALEAAHAAGIVHRDIKPANILLSADRTRLWVCDFGIARCTDDPSLTYAGAIAGTPRFMSPEQAAGEDLDGRSDLFSLGSLLYRCATGEFLVSGKTTVAVVRELSAAESAPKASKLATLPKFYRHLLHRLVAFNREERPADATAVIEAIETEKSKRPSRNRPGLLVGAFAIGVVLSAAAFHFVTTEKIDPVSAFVDAPSGNGIVTDLETGTSFQTLSEAIEAASPGAILRIRGSIPLEKEVRVYHEIHLVSDPETRGELVVTHSVENDHGLYLFETATIQGIRFVDPSASTRQRPLLGMTVENGSVTIEDCEFLEPFPFEDGAREAEFYALGVTNTESAIVRRCLFRTEKGIYLAANGYGNPTSSLTIEDSLFLCSEAIIARSKDDVGTIDATLTDSIVIADSLIEIFTPGKVSNLSLQVENCLLGLRQNLFDYTEPQAEALFERLSWTGSNNRFPAEMGLFPGVSESSASAEPFPVPSAAVNSRELRRITDLPSADLLKQLEMEAKSRRRGSP